MITTRSSLSGVKQHARACPARPPMQSPYSSPAGHPSRTGKAVKIQVERRGDSSMANQRQTDGLTDWIQSFQG